jgi:predicted secreted hydrolase
MSDGRELMVYRLRGADGRFTPFGGGSLIATDGRAKQLRSDDLAATPLAYWVSPRSGVRYPVRWRLVVPGENLSLDVVPYQDDQEIDLAVRYWEGAIRAVGRAGETPITAHGYLELAGY